MVDHRHLTSIQLWSDVARYKGQTGVAAESYNSESASRGWNDKQQASLKPALLLASRLHLHAKSQIKIRICAVHWAQSYNPCLHYLCIRALTGLLCFQILHQTCSYSGNPDLIWITGFHINLTWSGSLPSCTELHLNGIQILNVYECDGWNIFTRWKILLLHFASR